MILMIPDGHPQTVKSAGRKIMCGITRGRKIQVKTAVYMDFFNQQETERMNWKISPPLLLVGALTGIFLSVNGCSNQENYDSSHRYSAGSQKEAGITGWLLVLNSNEINAAKLALRKAVAPSVRNYAAQMQNQHMQNYNSTLNVARMLHVTPVYTAYSVRLEKAGVSEINRLSRYTGAGFDRAYMAAMISDHTMALSGLDHKIMSVKSSILKNQLEHTRSAVRLHLQEARDIQSRL